MGHRGGRKTKRTQNPRNSWLFRPRSAQTGPSVAGGGGRQGEGERALAPRCVSFGRGGAKNAPGPSDRAICAGNQAVARRRWRGRAGGAGFDEKGSDNGNRGIAMGCAEPQPAPSDQGFFLLEPQCTVLTHRKSFMRHGCVTHASLGSHFQLPCRQLTKGNTWSVEGTIAKNQSSAVSNGRCPWVHQVNLSLSSARLLSRRGELRPRASCCCGRRRCARRRSARRRRGRARQPCRRGRCGARPACRSRSS